jgi:hypothetical protein
LQNTDNIHWEHSLQGYLYLDVDFVIANFMTRFGILSWRKEGAIRTPPLAIPRIMNKQITITFDG